MWYIRRLMSNVVYQTFDVRCLMWYVRCLISDVVYETSDDYIRHQKSYIRYVISDVV